MLERRLKMLEMLEKKTVGKQSYQNPQLICEIITNQMNNRQKIFKLLKNWKRSGSKMSRNCDE